MLRRWLNVFLLFLFALPAAAQDAPLNVVATTTILADVAQNVGGDLVNVTPLLPPDTDTHAYEPTTDDAARVAQADMLLTVGAGYEAFITRLLENVGGDVNTVDVSRGLEILPLGLVGHEGEHDHEMVDIQDLTPWAGGHVSLWAFGIDAMQPAFDSVLASTPELTMDDVLAYYEAGTATAFDTFAVEGQNVTFTSGDTSSTCAYTFSGSADVPQFEGEVWWLFETGDANCAAYHYLLLMPSHAEEAGSIPHFHMRYGSTSFEEIMNDNSPWWPSIYPADTQIEAILNSWTASARGIGLYIADVVGKEVALSDAEAAAQTAEADEHNGEYLGVLGEGLECEAHEHEEGEEVDHEHGACDPHVWMNPLNVIGWVNNIVAAFSAADPENAALYQSNGESYIAQLQALDTEIETIVSAVPQDQRILLTNHEFMGYFAERYAFEVVATVLPGMNTGGEVDPQSLAGLIALVQEEQVPAIFAEVSANPQIADVIASESGVTVVTALYSESLGGADSPASTYLDFMRYNAQTIADALTTAE